MVCPGDRLPGNLWRVRRELYLEKFAFMIHPLDVRRDVSRKFPIARHLPVPLVEWGIKYLKPMVASHITGIRSLTGAEAEGWFVICPLAPRQFSSLPVEFVYKRMIECGHIAEELGAGILGLGAFTSVVGDGGITVADQLKIAVTTGNSYTVAVAIEETLEMAHRMEIALPANIAIVGATGSIGRAAAEILASDASQLTLIGRSNSNLEVLAEKIRPLCPGKVEVSTNVAEGIRAADLVVTVTSAVDTVIDPSFIKPGAVVCDVARPRDVSRRVSEERDDVLVIEGGMVQPPGPVDFGFNFGYPPGLSLACMAETMILALDGRYENYTLGKQVSAEQVRTIQALAHKHGFRIANPRSFEKPVTDEQIDGIRTRARLKSAGPPKINGQQGATA